MKLTQSQPVKFTKWKKIPDPLPDTTAYIRRIKKGQGQPYLELISTTKSKCLKCWGKGKKINMQYSWDEARPYREFYAETAEDCKKCRGRGYILDSKYKWTLKGAGVLAD